MLYFVSLYFFFLTRRLGPSEIELLTKKICWMKDPIAALKFVQGYLHMEYTFRSSSKTFWFAFFGEKKKPSMKAFSDMCHGFLLLNSSIFTNQVALPFHSFGHRTDTIHQSLYHRHSHMVLIKRRNPDQNWWSTL